MDHLTGSKNQFVYQILEWKVNLKYFLTWWPFEFEIQKFGQNYINYYNKKQMSQKFKCANKSVLRWGRGQMPLPSKASNLFIFKFS